jgi:hypothetical protein
MSDRVLQAEIVPLEPGCVGLELRWESGRLSAYTVADVAEAETELRRLEVDPAVVKVVYEELLQ